LLAEDNATNQIVVSHTLEKVGCDIDIANNGKEAVKAAQNRDYDCILMDISMPEMDGMEAGKRIKSSRRNTETPIIALTAYSLRGDRERFIASGMTDFLAKPVEKQDLLACISKNVHQRHSVKSETIGEAKGKSLLAAREILSTMPLELQKKLLLQFVEDTTKRLEAAQRAVATDDLETLERATHALKSVAGTFGASELTNIAATINSLARDNKSIAAMAKIDDLEVVCDRTLGEVKALADEMGIALSINT
jgi:CheY-like chemotaxis protein/HPt (histidine-containing phosphotransfer) domain-containing protein